MKAPPLHKDGTQARELPYDGDGYVNGETERRASRLLLAIQQFRVGTNPRYQPANGETFCNIFLWDWSRAVAAEVPHWFDVQGNAARPYARNALEMNVKRLIMWLETEPGHAHGWVQVSLEAAVLGAEAGLPVFGTWRNPNPLKHSHVAVLTPPALPEVYVAQAGAVCGDRVPLVNAFGNTTRVAAVQWWRHA